jgi:transcriptional regulator with XRE-family HTH domain
MVIWGDGYSMKQLEGFGKFLESLRGKMSLREAAQKSGLSHAYIRDLELERNRSTNDKIKPSPETLKKLSEAYNISYTELMGKVGYLETEEPGSSHAEVNLDEVLYIEVGAKEIFYHTAVVKFRGSVSSLIDFSDFLEHIEERGYKKLDTDLFVNLTRVKKYIEKEGKLFFDEMAEGKHVIISAMRQKRYHELLLRTAAANTGTSLEFNFGRSGLEASFQVKQGS